jgi:DNA-directed RNA polymerase specialized sigma24 family protein
MNRYSGQVRSASPERREAGEVSVPLECEASALSLLPSVREACSVADEVHARLCAVPRERLCSEPQAYLYALAADVIARADPHASSTPPEISSLHKALNELPAPWRAALLLQRCHQMSYEEIGKRLSVPASVAQQYVALALCHCVMRQAG